MNTNIVPIDHGQFQKHKLKCVRRASIADRDWIDNILNVSLCVLFGPMTESDRTGFPELKGSGGVYLFFRDDRLLYVGYSNWLRFRLTGHAKKWLSLDPEYFPTHAEVICIQDLDFATKLESWLIEVLKPPLNRSVSKFDGITDEQKERALTARLTENVFSDYGVLETETNVFHGWYKSFEDAFYEYERLAEIGDGSWRLVTPAQYCP